MTTTTHDTPVAPATDPNVHPEDKPRINRLCRVVLERLQTGPAYSHELATISHRFGARISDLREAGYDIATQRLPGGVYLYSLAQ
jgi:hypothetical protein